MSIGHKILYLGIAASIIAAAAHAQMLPEKFSNVAGIRFIKEYDSENSLNTVFRLNDSGDVLEKTTRLQSDCFFYNHRQLTKVQTFFFDSKDLSLPKVLLNKDTCHLEMQDDYTYFGGRLTTLHSRYDLHIKARTSEKIAYLYTIDGKLKREEIMDSIYNSSNRKEYTYYPYKTTIHYYVGKKLTGVQEITRSKDGRIKSDILRDTHGKTLSSKKYTYTTDGLVRARTSYDSGMDGFGIKRYGNILDKTTYEYDASRRLAKRKEYYKGEIEYEYSYKYGASIKD